MQRLRIKRTIAKAAAMLPKLHKKIACHTPTFRWENRPLCVWDALFGE